MGIPLVILRLGLYVPHPGSGRRSVKDRGFYGPTWSPRRQCPVTPIVEGDKKGSNMFGSFLCLVSLRTAFPSTYPPSFGYCRDLWFEHERPTAQDLEVAPNFSIPSNSISSVRFFQL